MSGARKRKAEELDDGTRDGSNGAQAPKRESSAQETWAAPPAEMVYYVHTAVTKPDRRAFQAKVEIAHNFSTDYQVTGGDWGAMKSYKKISLPDQTFQMNDIVYILKEGERPPPPNEDEASPLEILHYDRSAYAVGKILDCRASSRHDVHVLIAYLYWPEELPGGRLPHHSQAELILSNHFEIIDPQSMSSISDIAYWNEFDDDARIPDRFWRQTYHVERPKLSGLSKLREHCKCHQPHNPDQKMYRCGDCGVWNHEKCLVEDVAAIAYREYKKDTLDQYAKDHRPPESVLEKIERLKDGITKTLANVGNALLHDPNGSVEATPSKGKKVGRPKKNAQPWEAELSAELIKHESDRLESDSKDTEVAPAVRITEKSGQQRHWDLTANCLNGTCGKLLD